MNYSDVTHMIDQPSRELARRSLYTLLRQGLTNGAAIPEIETEPEQAAHHLLGCTNYVALLVLYCTAEDARKNDSAVAAVIIDIADERLKLLTEAVLTAHGPIGAHDCHTDT